jgi:hypothetical protein
VKHELEHIEVDGAQMWGFNIENSSLRMPELTLLAVGFVFFSNLAINVPGVQWHAQEFCSGVGGGFNNFC